MRKGDKLWYAYVYLPKHCKEGFGPFTSKPVAERHVRTWLEGLGLKAPFDVLLDNGTISLYVMEIVE